MFEREKHVAVRKELDEQKEADRKRFESMIRDQMGTAQGRNFVCYILGLLRWNEPNIDCNANAYRVAAIQNVAIDIYKQIYDIVPDMTERMGREKKEGQYVLRREM